MNTTIILAKGSHPAPAEDCGNPQRCLMEWYNWLTRHEHTDACPPGVSLVLHRFGMSLNDILPDDKRQQLVRFLPNGADVLAGTARDGLDETRGYLALDWLTRTYLPAWLDLAGLTGEAATLRGSLPVVDLAAAQVIGRVVRDSASKARAAWAAAGAAARAAWAAARAAARDAARAAGYAAWEVGDAAGDAAWDAAGDAAWDAAGAAAGDAARAAGYALAPTVASLQDSAIALYAAMITGGVS